MLGLLGSGACQPFRSPDAFPPLFDIDPRTVELDGEAVVVGATPTDVRYQRPFESPPRLRLVGLTRSEYQDKPNHLSDLDIVRQDATGFTVRNVHADAMQQSWVTVKWEARGLRVGPAPVAALTPGSPAGERAKTAEEELVDRVKELGGRVTYDPPPPDGKVIGVDLHDTAAGDADLARLSRWTGLKLLNLSNTRVTDAGLSHLKEMTVLRTLYLNETAVSDAGLLHLQGLKSLYELGLYRTRVTDAGLVTLQSLPGLGSLNLIDDRITDQGLPSLKALRGLRQIFLNHTGVTPDGVAGLKKALPAAQVFK